MPKRKKIKKSYTDGKKLIKDLTALIDDFNSLVAKEGGSYKPVAPIPPDVKQAPNDMIETEIKSKKPFDLEHFSKVLDELCKLVEDFEKWSEIGTQKDKETEKEYEKHIENQSKPVRED